MKTLNSFNFKGKTVLVRSDLNSPVVNGKIVDNERISESARTIKELKRKGARVVVLSHQSRPGKKDFRGLKEHAKLLNKYVKTKFVDDVIGKRAVSEIQSLKNGEVLLLGNVRNLRGEFKPGKNRMVRVLGKLCEIYVNDAFSVSHRRHTSIVSFPSVMKSCVGRLMEAELKSLGKLKKDCLYILGGAKPEDNIMLLKKSKGKVLTCGLFGQLCLVAKGHSLGRQEKVLKGEMKHLRELSKLVNKTKTPMDLAVKVRGRRREMLVSEFPSKFEIFDIGKRTQEEYTRIISNAKAIFMKGTAGFCEETQFCVGTRVLLEAIGKSKGYSVLGGGHLSSALGKMKINKKKFDYVSLSGGALARYLAGEKLVGVEALKKR